MVKTSASKESGYQNALEPRPSIAKTSISIPSVTDIESLTDELMYKTEHSVTKHLSRLELASTYLSPVIDEIFSRATSYTQNEFRELLESRSPICAISVRQFTRACKASEIIDEVQKNPYPIPEYVVNTMAQSREDKIFIDRDLMNQLVDLQNMIIETIRKLKGTLAEDMKVENVKMNLEENFVIVDKTSEDVKTESQSDNKSETESTKRDDDISGIKTLTVNVDKNMKDPKESNEVSEITAEIPTPGDLYAPLDDEPITESEETEKTEPMTLQTKCDGEINSDGSELMTKTDINDADNILIKPSTTKEDCLCSNERIPKRVSEHTGLDIIDSKCKMEFTKFQAELDKMKQIVFTLANEVQLIKEGNLVKNEIVKVSEPTNTMDSNHASFQGHLEFEILDCLKELRQIKDALGGMNNPNLTLDITPRDPGSPCCKLNDFPHLHAKLDGIPVIIKLNKSSIDILLAENEKKNEREVQVNEQIIRRVTEKRNHKCVCNSKKQIDAMVVTKVHSTVHTKYNAIPYPLNIHSKEVQVVNRKKHKTVVQSAFTNHCFEESDLDDRESITGLPYTVHKKSLPSMNICPPMNINVDQLKKGMRSDSIEHPKMRIRKQLVAVGVDNLIKASIPAVCCRKAVINEAERDDQPFHASINSLPLTTSDLQVITEVTGQESCMHLTKQPFQIQFEYYTNFQENLASNIDYYMPKSRVYEVRFFRIFKKDEHKPPKTGLAERLSEVLRRIIYHNNNNNNNNNANGEESKKSEKEHSKLSKNKKCQTEQPPANHKPTMESPSQFTKILPTTKSKRPCYNKVRSSNKGISCSVQCRMSEECEGCRKKLRTKLRTKRNLIENNVESICDFMKPPNISESIQKLLNADEAVKALERSNLDTDQFWGLYFEAKKSYRSLHCERGSSDGFSLPRRAGYSGCPPRNRYGKYRRSSVSRIPKRIVNVKHTYSSTSSDVSMIKGNKKLKTQEKVEKQEFVVTVKQNPELKVDSKKKIPETPSALSILELADKYDSDVTDKTKIFFNENMHDTPSTDFKDNSLESLQLLASKNGPGYITVLHPVCGCPEVSIFIPCYCPVTAKNVMSQHTVHKLVCRNDGRHIVLPKGCRVEKFEEGNCNDHIKED